MESNTKIKVIYTVDKQEKYAADLDQALKVAGLGWCNLKHSSVLALVLMAYSLDQIGYSLVLPGAACDLQMSDKMRGFVGSMPYIGIFLTSFPWGYLADTRGRKNTLIYSSLIIGIFSVIAGLMPNLSTFAVCKFISSLGYSCAGAVPFTFIDEILPAKYRDVMISIMNGLSMIGALLVPLLAWAILPANFNIYFGAYIFRPWRLLNIIFAIPFIIAAILLFFCPESPKYLVSQQNNDEAIAVMREMYALNKGKKPEEFPVSLLIDTTNNLKHISFLTSLKEHTQPFLKWFYLKWMLLIGFLLFGNTAILNGLYIWAPEVINRILNDVSKGKTACQVISIKVNETLAKDAVCNENMNEMTLLINSVSQACCTVIILIVSLSVKFLGKKSILILCFWYTGIACILMNIIANDVVFAVLLLSLPILVLTLGSINAYTVEIVPTHMRGVALTVTIMLGNIGSIAANNVTGLMINDACKEMFYLFAGLLLLCGALSFLLPSSETTKRKQAEYNAGLK